MHRVAAVVWTRTATTGAIPTAVTCGGLAVGQQTGYGVPAERKLHFTADPTRCPHRRREGVQEGGRCGRCEESPWPQPFRVSARTFWTTSTNDWRRQTPTLPPAIRRRGRPPTGAPRVRP